ncbi:MAG: hypothetical protein ACI97A_003652 [Planctomycetota bacterium]|jgi:hypothetical protein
MNKFSTQSGTVMVTTIFLVIVVVVLSMSYLSASFQFGISSASEKNLMRARLVAEEATYLSIAELKAGVDTDGDGLGALSFQGADARNATTLVEDLGGNLYRIHSNGTFGTTSQAIECVVQMIPAGALNLSARAAVTAEGPVLTSGNINVDGRDWDEWGNNIVGPGVFGISTTQTVAQNGSSTIGGVGSAPNGPAAPGSFEQFASWADGVDNDGDLLTDEELFDGIDNDGDGLIDEDTSNFPSDPDVMFGLPKDTLKQIAQAAGTYFDSETELNNYISSNGGNVPGGVVLFAEFDLWQPVDLGNGFNDPPSLVVHHNSTGTAVMKNVHGAFRGMLMADFVEHVNGDFVLVGAFMSFSDESIGNAFGNGGADILYSSSVLGGLPGGNGSSRARVLSWRKAALDI